MIHTCSADIIGRKRQYQASLLNDLTPILGAYVSTSNKRGNTNQLKQMMKTTAGVEMATSQANRLVHEKSHTTIKAQLAQYFCIPSIFDDVFKADDPGGIYVFDTVPCLWERSYQQFHRCYCCPSFSSKAFWAEGEIRLLIGDGTFTKGLAFKHVLLLVVTFNSNNRLVVLCFAVVPVEDVDYWVWFHGMLKEDFPGFDVFMSDWDKGITSNRFQQSQEKANVISSQCARHMAKSCQKNVVAP